jgi:hypothetical protein
LKGCTGHNVFVWSIEATMLVVCFVFIGDVRISNETIMNAVLLVTKYSFVLYACYILGGLFIGTSFLRRTT